MASEPMRDERLAEIRASLERLNAAVQAALNPPPTLVDVRHPEPESAPIPVSTIFMAMTALELLQEVERQRASESATQETIEHLLVRNGELFDIVRVVAEADNSDSSICYQLCRVRWYGGETDAEEMEMRHDAPCVVEQACALLAGPAATGEQEAQDEANEP